MLKEQLPNASHEVSWLHRDIAAQMRIIRLLKNVLIGLEPRLRKFSSSELKPYFEDINEHLDHLWNDIEDCHETIEIYKDNYSLLRQERSNKIMAVLTILFTISLPASILSTFFGMHVNIPWGSENGGWVGFLGTYTAFFIIVIVAFVMAALMFWFFRHRKWL